jgi:hypothetical protein
MSHWISRPERGLDHPLNLSILVSGGLKTEEDSLSNGERTGRGSDQKASSFGSCAVVFRRGASGCTDISPLVAGVVEGEIPVSYLCQPRVRPVFSESCSLRWERKDGGTFHPKLNIASRPIANKYREGKVQSTLKRGLNVPEIAAMQAYETCFISEGLGSAR